MITPTDILRWRQASANGFELGNHTVNHPCPRAMLPNRDHYATESYDEAAMLTEIAVMNDVLFGIDGRTRRAMSYPCSQTRVAAGTIGRRFVRQG